MLFNLKHYLELLCIRAFTFTAEYFELIMEYKDPAGPCIVVWQTQSSAMMPASHSGISLCPGCSTLDPAPCLWLGEVVHVGSSPCASVPM